MKSFVLALSSASVILISGFARGQEPTPQQGTPQSQDLNDRLGKLEPLNRVLFDAKKAAAAQEAAKAKAEAEAAAAAAKKAELEQKLKDEQSRPRTPEVIPQALARQPLLVEDVQAAQATYAKAQESVAIQTIKLEEAKEKVQAASKDENGNAVKLPDWAEAKASEVPLPSPSGPRFHNSFVHPDQGSVWDLAKAADGLRGSTGKVFDTSRSFTDPGVVDARGSSTQSFNSGGRPVEPRPIAGEASREQPLLVKPGGVIISACAEIPDLKPGDVGSASFDATSGALALSLRSGKQLVCKLNSDDFIIAIRSIYERRIDPSLSMDFSKEKPEYFSVGYTGPLFKTGFGKKLYLVDMLLGDIFFNREGENRSRISATVPHFADTVNEVFQSMTVGSRVFLQATSARFAIEQDQLVCRKIQSKIEVEGSNYDAHYHHESLRRLSRVVGEHYDSIAEQYSELKDFNRLVECVAIAKWLKKNEIPFDWASLSKRPVAECPFPAFVPTAQWCRIFGGRNLDGWRIGLASGKFDWSLGTEFSLKPTTSAAVPLLSSVYATKYDLRFAVQTEGGPVEVIIRDGVGEGLASVLIDTKSEKHIVELFIRDGEWSAVAPAFKKSGKVVIPKPVDGQQAVPSDFGFRVPAGSKLTLHAAAMRNW